MKIGAHVSAAGGIFNAPLNAAKMGCEAFQVFSRSPQGGPAPKLLDEIVTRFRTAVREYRQHQVVIHTPYYINFASTTPRIRYGSISIVRDELERATLLGAQYVVTHLGSTKDAGPKIGFHKTWRSLQRILDGYEGSAMLLLEGSTGAGDLVGGTFEQLAELIKNVEAKPQFRGKVGVCIDTCHAFAAGYDIRTKTGVNTVVRKMERTFGLRRLKLLHANDSKFGLNAHRDRHEHIGMGEIGLAGFRALVNHPKLQRVNMILETPWDGTLANDLETLKGMRRKR